MGEQQIRLWEALAYNGIIMLAVLALVELVDETGRYEGTVKPIAERARQQPRTTRAALNILERDGWLRIERGKLGLPDRINVYQLSEQLMEKVKVKEAVA